jgi:plastocyanin
MRRRYLPLAAVLGVAVAVLPTVAGSTETTQHVNAASAGSYGFAWSPKEVTVGAGGGVVFANMTPGTPHGIIWTSSAKPECGSTVPVGEGKSSSAEWSGTCTFSQAVTYTYECSVHRTAMTGTIVVNGTTTPTPTTPTTTTTTTTTPTTPVEPPSGSPLAGGPSLRSSQRGGAVKGSLDISKAGAGDRLQVDVFAKSASLAKAKRSTRVRVGRLVRGSVSAGKVSFVVKLNARARSALKRHHRLALTVKITLTPVHGEPLTVTRTVVEHG